MASHDDVIKAVAIPEYQDDFQKVFGRAPRIDDVVAAIAAFERTVVSGDSPFDRFMAGDKTAMSAEAQRGWALFNGKARCNTCHAFGDATPIFSDNKFHNIGVAAKGRDFAAIARQAADHRRPGGARARAGLLRARPLRGHRAAEGHRRLQDVGPAQHRADRALHARRQRGDAAGRDEPLQQGRRAQPVPRRRHRPAGAHRAGESRTWWRSWRRSPARATARPRAPRSRIRTARRVRSEEEGPPRAVPGRARPVLRPRAAPGPPRLHEGGRHRGRRRGRVRQDPAAVVPAGRRRARGRAARSRSASRTSRTRTSTSRRSTTASCARCCARSTT